MKYPGQTMQVQAVLVALYFYLICPANIIGLWWAVGSPLVMDPNTICRKSRRLAGKQHNICKNEQEIVREITKGARLALSECQYQFAARHWNCTTARRSFGKILRRDLRETAFVYAITAAGVTYSVTQACSAGSLLQCTCDRNHIRDKSTDGQWAWGGCGDDVDFGYLKSREFMDARKKKRCDITTKIRMHNNEAGRLAVKNYMRRVCKCHGLSGSCTLQTCWRKMPLFRHVGNRLKEKFKGAAKVIISNDGLHVIPEGDTIKKPDVTDLIYSENSPDFCRPSRKAGSLGTKGRICDIYSRGVGGCDVLCCNRGYKKGYVTLRENCKCRFIWCCDVICQECVHNKTIYTCL
uniref:Protein Wnt n=1 Tax=Doryteuthis pealeii TaxID=1051067 RepID=A0A8E6P5C6_DORPE|nr:wnt 6 [Doryteuthis pealeii]